MFFKQPQFLHKKNMKGAIIFPDQSSLISSLNPEPCMLVMLIPG